MITDADIEKAAVALAIHEGGDEDTAWEYKAQARAALEAVDYHSWMPIDDGAKSGAYVMIASKRLDSGYGVARWDETWGDGGWWLLDDGKDTEIPLRGDEPTHYKPLDKLPG